MSFKQDLENLSGLMLRISIHSPDQYPVWMLEYYNNSKEIFDEDMSGGF